MPLVLAFGVFDNLHDGHRFFLKQCSTRGKLHVVVAPDAQVVALKGRRPLQGEQVRLEAVSHLPYVTWAELGDQEQGTYSIILRLNPDLICLGHDQSMLESSLHSFCDDHSLTPEFIHVSGYNTDRLKSSLLNRYD